MATDYCVGSTAVDAKLFFPDMDVVLIEDCMKGVDDVSVAGKRRLMVSKGLTLYQSVDNFMASPHAN